MPKIIEITAGDQAGFNHPFEQYSNFKPSITLRAVLLDGEDPVKAIQNLQRDAHDCVEAEKDRILKHLAIEHAVERTEAIISSRRAQIANGEKLIAEDDAKSEEERRENCACVVGYDPVADARESIETWRAELAAYQERLHLLEYGTHPDDLPPISV
ncbi:hypothetical protein [Geminisphaera colitermitum]|uniref:hypothetical protein n=1 Tax=Geminisphaera colitermitum TaxID=1148786 RepID=UPI000158C703|nr:hypothetical protein [Geminisphaera colitermitum]